MLARKTSRGQGPQKLFRFARILVLVVFFFAGAALSAVGGNTVVEAIEGESTPAEEPVTDPAPPPATDPVDQPLTDEPPLEPPVTEEPAPSPEATQDVGNAAQEQPEPSGSSSQPSTGGQKGGSKKAGDGEKKTKPKEKENERPPVPRWPTYWVPRSVPQPVYTENLRPPFAKRLEETAAGARVDWALLLAVLRVNGSTGKVPAKEDELRRLANKLARLGPRDDSGHIVRRLSSADSYEDQVLALARYHRVVGLKALTRGLETARKRLTARLLEDPRIDLRPEGRSDIAAGRIEVRVMAMIAYLADTYGQVSVTSLLSGHRLYARPGVISAHIYGRAVDIGSLGGVSILSNTRPGGTTERGVYEILLAPGQIRPRQVISVLGLGGPSFPLSDHGDHIHIGW